MKTMQKQFSLNGAAAKSNSLSLILDSQFEGHDARVFRAMNRVVITAIAGVLSCLLTGCSSPVRLGAFRDAGCPVDNKAVLRLIKFPRAFAEVRIDDEVVGTRLYTFVEMLPGRHQIDVEWFSHKVSRNGNERPDHSHKGEFVAENGREYYLFIDMDERSWSDNSYYHSEFTVRGVSILEFPADFHATKWREIDLLRKYTARTETSVPNYELLRKFKTVAILRPSEGASRTITNSTPDTATSGPPVSGSATSGDSKPVMIGTGSVAYSTENIKLGLAMSFMENECTRQGIHVLTRSDFEDKVRTVLKKNGADSIKLQYKDDGTTKTITVAP
jgi:hypothetical protein